MKQFSLFRDKLKNKDKFADAENNHRKIGLSEFILMTKYYFVKSSRWRFYWLVGFVIIAVFGLSKISRFDFASTNIQSLDIKGKLSQLNTQKASSAKLIKASVDNFAKESQISTTEIIENYHHFRKKNHLEVLYNVNKTPKLNYDNQKLSNIVDELVDLANAQDLPKKSLSITLIDINRHQISGYQQHVPRFPASVVKLFWMVALEEYIQQGLISNERGINPSLKAMIVDSDNDASSRIIDVVTKTKSFSKRLDAEEFQVLKNRRNHLNQFFQKAGYQNIVISNKTFPITELRMSEPTGTELQLIGDDKLKSNQITTYHAARLMYEIFNQQAVSPKLSQKMANLLHRDLRPQKWKNNPPRSEGFNPVENFFGESLPADIYFASKAGQNSTTRNEVAYVATEDGKTRYVIAIFGKDKAYSQSNRIFPQMSKLVFRRMTNQERK